MSIRPQGCRRIHAKNAPSGGEARDRRHQQQEKRRDQKSQRIARADPEKQVLRLAQLAVNSGLRGLVCSPLEIVALRKVLPAHVQLVTPGIRTGAEKADDQKRTLSPRQAVQAGADWLVVGRPIYAAENPRLAAEKILESLAI